MSSQIDVEQIKTDVENLLSAPNVSGLERGIILKLLVLEHLQQSENLTPEQATYYSEIVTEIFDHLI